MKLHNLKINQRNPRAAKFWIDDKEIVGVKHYSINANGGDNTRVMLTIVFENITIESTKDHRDG